MCIIKTIVYLVGVCIGAYRCDLSVQFGNNLYQLSIAHNRGGWQKLFFPPNE